MVTPMKTLINGLVGLGLLLWLPAVAAIDLATVPERDSVQLTIYNSEDLTLVRETRRITFKRGLNPLQFSWANTLIDPSSVELRFPDRETGLAVRDTRFPHDRPQQLLWRVDSDADREVTVEISYFTSGISWAADYLVFTDPDTGKLRLESFVRVINRSGEDYDDARIRLVVGTINLVEKIAELARVPVGRLDEMVVGRQRDELRQMAVRALMDRPAVAAEAVAAPAPKEIIKEGLSEYFIYTIEGTESVPHGWSKRLRSFVAEDVPYRTQYRYRPVEYGDRLVRVLKLRNDEASGLGSTPLPDGEVRLFEADEQASLRLLGSQSISYVPIGDEIVFNLGPDPEVLFEAVTDRIYRSEIWLRVRGANLYQRVDQPGLRIDPQSEVAGWNQHDIAARRIRNYRDQALEVELRLSFDGDVTFRSLLEPRLHDYRTLEITTTVEPRSEQRLAYELIRREGYNQQQRQITLETGAPRPLTD